jgi:DNA-directed RNA polymerase subunit K/omega
MSEPSKAPTRPQNSFEFVTIAAARARQLLEGCVPRVEGSAKPARRAVEEVAQGVINRVPESPEPKA